MQPVDILLIDPHWSQLSDAIEHMGLAYLAANARIRGLSAAIVDAPVLGLDNLRTIGYIRRYDPRVIGVSLLFQEGAGEAIELIRMIRRQLSCHITVGGIYPSFEYRSILRDYPEIDSVVLGEGEETLPCLVRAVKDAQPLGEVDGIAYRLDGEIIETKKRPLVADLDALPFPARDTLLHVLKTHSYAAIVSSRGCYGRCSFCSVDGFFSAYGPKYRSRSPQNVVDEMQMLIERYGVRNFMFNDANFIGSGKRGRDRARAIADEILTRGIRCEYRIQCRADDIEETLFARLKEAGLSRAYVGIESGSPTQLERYQKDITVEQNLEALSILDRLGLHAKVGFIMFDPDVTVDELMENTRFINTVKKLKHVGYIYPAGAIIPLSGSRMQETLAERGVLSGDYTSYAYQFQHREINGMYRSMRRVAATVSSVRGKRKRDKDDMDLDGGWTVWDDSGCR